MEYKRIDDTVFLRVDPDEDIVEQLKVMALKENIKLAEVNGLGALKALTVGLFAVNEKAFHGNHFVGAYEMTSLHGTITTKDGEYYSHLHMNAGDVNGKVVGGHLTQAVVSATAEIDVRIINGTLERRFDENIGLNLFKF